MKYKITKLFASSKKSTQPKDVPLKSKLKQKRKTFFLQRTARMTSK